MVRLEVQTFFCDNCDNTLLRTTSHPLTPTPLLPHQFIFRQINTHIQNTRAQVAFGREDRTQVDEEEADRQYLMGIYDAESLNNDILKVFNAYTTGQKKRSPPGWSQATCPGMGFGANPRKFLGGEMPFGRPDVFDVFGGPPPGWVGPLSV